MPRPFPRLATLVHEPGEPFGGPLDPLAGPFDVLLFGEEAPVPARWKPDYALFSNPHTYKKVSLGHGRSFSGLSWKFSESSGNSPSPWVRGRPSRR